ncbi:MAG: hypothetical protein HY290_06020 [Planctomycetia bacterium]|nr:hypothetical protein [Planctomycetia bacterium]
MIPAVHPAGATTAANLSGAAWWQANQAKFPNSESVDDLAMPFRESVRQFLAALAVAGARVTIDTTRRNKQRAYLMHSSWGIAHGQISPAKVSAEPGVNIVWDHGNLAASRTAAQQMVNLFHMAYDAALNSNHIAGNAIDMTITWVGKMKIKNKAGHVVEIGAPFDGAHNAHLHTVGAGYGVKKLLKDPPHWSVNGH